MFRQCVPLVFMALIMVENLNAAEVKLPNRDLTLSLRGGPPKLQRLIGAHLQVFPESFPHRDIYFMTDLDRLVYNQGRLIEKISRMPDYRSDIESRGPLLDLRITAKQGYHFSARIFDPAELRAWNREMVKLVQAERNGQILDRLHAQIVDNYQEYRRRMQVSYVFEGKTAYQQSVIAFVMAYGLSQRGKDFSGLHGNFELEQGHIDYLSEEDVWRPCLDRLMLSLKDDLKTDFQRHFKDILHHWEMKLKSMGYRAKDSPSEFEVAPGRTIHLFEAHPDLAVLRGFVGNDCATAVSFGFPYSPFERNYYITDDKFNFIGYVALSVVEVRGVRTLFFHTIAGPRVTHVDADMIIKGVFAAREKIGGSLMVLPEDHRIHDNINFFPIDEMMRRYVTGVAAEPVKWLDADYRDLIGDTGSDMFYDNPERNRLGRVLDVATDAFEVAVTSRPYVSPLDEPGFTTPVFSVARPVASCIDTIGPRASLPPNQ